MPLPNDADADKVAEVALALLDLTKHGDHGGVRAWKGLDWDVMDLLFEKGWILDPKGKAKSVVLTESGSRAMLAVFAW